MAERKIVSLLLSLSWVLLIGLILSSFFSKNLLPLEIINFQANNPFNNYAIVSGLISIVLLAAISVKHFLNKTDNILPLYLISLAFFMLHFYFRGTVVFFASTDFFKYTLDITLGAILGFLVSLKSIRAFRAVLLSNLFLLVLLFVAFLITHNQIPTSLIQFAKNSNAYSNFVDSIVPFVFLSYLLAMIGLFWRQNWARHLYCAFLATSLLVFNREAVTGLFTVINYLQSVSSGLILTMIFRPFIAEKFVKASLQWKKINIFRTVILASFSKNFFQEVAHSWRGIGLSYLVSISFFAAILILPHSNSISVSSFLDATTDENLIKQVPTVTIEKGIISVDVKTPYTIYTKDKQPFITFDKYGNLANFKQLKSQLIMTENHIYIHLNNGKIRDMPVPDHITLKPHLFFQFFSVIFALANLVIFLGLWLFWIVLTLITSIIATMIRNRSFKLDLKSLRISTLLITTPLITWLSLTAIDCHLLAVLSSISISFIQYKFTGFRKEASLSSSV